MNALIKNLPHELQPVGELLSADAPATAKSLAELGLAWHPQARYVLVEPEGGAVRLTTDGVTAPVVGSVGFLRAVTVLTGRGEGKLMKLINEGATRVHVQQYRLP